MSLLRVLLVDGGTSHLFEPRGLDNNRDKEGQTLFLKIGNCPLFPKRVIKQDGTTYEYYYDPDGNRIRKEKIQNGQIVEPTNYIIDANTIYAQVILEIDDQNVIIASYTYGDDLLKMSRNGEYFYWYDGLGSVRIITDITGAVVNRYTYDAYGTSVDGEYAETIANDYKFSGERVDAETGFVYLRARMYEAGTGRFLTRDPFRGLEYDPPTLHRYIYTANDPVNRIDPDGRFFAMVGLVLAVAVNLLTRIGHDTAAIGFGLGAAGALAATISSHQVALVLIATAISIAAAAVTVAYLAAQAAGDGYGDPKDRHPRGWTYHNLVDDEIGISKKAFRIGRRKYRVTNHAWKTSEDTDQMTRVIKQGRRVSTVTDSGAPAWKYTLRRWSVVVEKATDIVVTVTKPL